MKWIIDIPESTITDLKKKENRTEVDIAVLNGTPLPKGHGRLIDTSQEVEVQLYDDEHEEFTKQMMTIEEYLNRYTNGAITIIEAAKAKQADKKNFISDDEAIALLPEGEYIHTFRESGLALIGADWLREEIIELIRKSDCLELTGEGARSMYHGLAIYDHDAKMQSDILFVETDMEKLQALDPDEEAEDEGKSEVENGNDD